MYAITRYASHHPCTSRCIKIINFLILILYIKSIKERHLSLFLAAFSSHLIRAAPPLHHFHHTAHTTRFYCIYIYLTMDHSTDAFNASESAYYRLFDAIWYADFASFFSPACQLSVLMHVVSRHAPFHTNTHGDNLRALCEFWPPSCIKCDASRR